MANSIYQKLALVAVGTVLSLAALENPLAQAAIITYDFTVNIPSGDFQDNYKGFFTYDDAAPSGISNLFYPYFAPTEFSFEFRGKTYKNLRFANRGIIIPPLSYLTFTNPKVVVDKGVYLVPGGELDKVRFLVTDVSPASGIGSYILLFEPNFGFGFEFFDRFFYNPISSGGGTWSYKLREQPTSNSVPEPATVFGLSMLGFGWLLRKKPASSHK